MIQLFLDANILLDFYRYGADDISEVYKLVTLIEDQEVYLHTNDHLVNEVERAREGILGASFSELRSTKYGLKVPNYCATLPELIVVTEGLKQVNAAHSRLVEAAAKLIKSGSLAADQLIQKLFAASERTEVSAAVIARADARVKLGNPPGKGGSLGDAIHWESLLENPRAFRTHLVTRDGDFASALTPTVIKDFLSREWILKHGKGSKVILHKSLGEFFKSAYPHIELSEEAAKSELISQLMASPNFATTHSVIAKLGKHKHFTNGQATRVFEALATNSQVNWIASDPDVRQFFLGLKDKAYMAHYDYHTDIAGYLEVDENEFFSPF